MATLLDLPELVMYPSPTPQYKNVQDPPTCVLFPVCLSCVNTHTHTFSSIFLGFSDSWSCVQSNIIWSWDPLWHSRLISAPLPVMSQHVPPLPPPPSKNPLIGHQTGFMTLSTFSYFNLPVLFQTLSWFIPSALAAWESAPPSPILQSAKGKGAVRVMKRMALFPPRCPIL